MKSTAVVVAGIVVLTIAGLVVLAVKPEQGPTAAGFLVPTIASLLLLLRVERTGRAVAEVHDLVNGTEQAAEVALEAVDHAKELASAVAAAAMAEVQRIASLSQTAIRDGAAQAVREAMAARSSDTRTRATDVDQHQQGREL
ncbi:MAG: hypothetical protein ACR2MO_08620 [Acidimicrobiales bacterium]